MKECAKCGKTKEYSQFSKKTKSKDGYQDRCKMCNRVDNKYFRTELNPEHHAKWQEQNRQRAAYHVSKWRKSDKAGIIYGLVAPDGAVYVGQTKTYLSVRIMEHKVKYKRYKTGKQTSIHPLLFESFDKYGVENHKIKILFEDQTIDRKALKQIETSFIKAFKQQNKSLNIIN